MESEKGKKQTQTNKKTTVEPVPVMKKKNGIPTLFLVLTVALIVFAGIATGYVLADQQVGVTMTETGSKMVKTDKIIGSLDQNFKDEAQGKLEKGGIEGEGTHHLVRDGGPSQYVYLISSVVDLSQFEGKNVKVWGETNAAQKAGWLMDVGKLELLE